MKKNIRTICEGAVCVALAFALSYLKLDIAALGGSVDIVMVPLIIFALRRGWLPGIEAGLVFGIIKYFFAGGFAISWASMLLDYVLAYGTVGLAGLVSNRKLSPVTGTLIGGFARFFIHFLSGVTIYLEYAEPTFMGLATPSPVVYSIIYNGAYMIPNIVAALILVPILFKALKRVNLDKDK